MAKDISISIRVSNEELDKFKLAARLEACLLMQIDDYSIW